MINNNLLKAQVFYEDSLEEPTLSQSVRAANLSDLLPPGSRKRELENDIESAWDDSARMEIGEVAKRGFDSPNNDDLIDALKNIDETSPLVYAAKSWDIEKIGTEVEISLNMRDGPIEGKGKEKFVDDLRESSRQREKYGDRPISKDELIASAANAKIPSSAYSGVRKKARTGPLFPSQDARPGDAQP